MGGQNSKVSYDYVRLQITENTPFLDDSYVNDANKIVDDCEKAGKDNNILNLTCLKDLLKLLVDAILNATKSIKDCKLPNIWKDKEFYYLKKEFIDNTDSILAFFTKLENRLRGTQTNQLELEIALARFDKGTKDNYDVTVLSSTLNKVRKFRKDGEPFAKYFKDLLKEIQRRHDKMEKRIKKSKVKRIILCSMFAAVSASLLALSIVGLGLTTIPIFMGVIGVGLACDVAAAGIHVHAKSKNLERARKQHSELQEFVNRETDNSVVELKNIHTLFQSMESKLEQMSQTSKLALGYGNDITSLTKATEMLRELAPAFNETVGSLCIQVDECRNNIIAARKSLLTERPSSSKQ